MTKLLGLNHEPSDISYNRCPMYVPLDGWDNVKKSGWCRDAATYNANHVTLRALNIAVSGKYSLKDLL